MDDMNEPYDVVNNFATEYRSVLNGPLCDSVECLSTSFSNQECILSKLTLTSLDEATGKNGTVLWWDFNSL